MGDDGHSDARHCPEGESAEVWIAVGKGLLDCVDREQGGVGRSFGMADEKGVDELLDFEIGGGNVLDNGGEVVNTGFRIGQLPEVSIYDMHADPGRATYRNHSSQAF